MQALALESAEGHLAEMDGMKESWKTFPEWEEETNAGKWCRSNRSLHRCSHRDLSEVSSVKDSRHPLNIECKYFSIADFSDDEAVHPECLGRSIQDEAMNDGESDIQAQPGYRFSACVHLGRISSQLIVSDAIRQQSAYSDTTM
jgi:hypothetical protein